MVLLALGINLSFTARTWPVSLAGLVGGMALIVVGDVAYGIIGVEGKTYSSPLLDVPFLLAYVLLGVSVLHRRWSSWGTRPGTRCRRGPGGG